MPEAMRYDAARRELVDFVPEGATRLLDIGCAAGGYATQVAAHLPEIELWGVEPDEVAANAARPHYHRLVHAAFPAAASDLPQAAFDVVVFNDVLEHLVDPQEAIEAARPLLSDRGVIVASIPNVRHRSVIWPLVRAGRWDYTDTGLLDRTHLRFFTRATMAEMFEGLGWSVESQVGINRKWDLDDGAERRRLRVVRRAVGSRFDDFFFIQYVVTARPEPRT